MQKIVDQMVASQGHLTVKAQARRQLERFATALAAKHQIPTTRVATSVAPAKTRTFDEIADSVQRDSRAVLSEQELPRKNLPFGAGLQKQRTCSEGNARLRFRGQLVK